MARAPFSVFKQTSRNSNGETVTRFRVKFFDEDGHVVKTKTLDATSSTKATLEAKVLFDKGKGISQTDPLVLDFLASFWKVDSDYAKMKTLRGQPLSRKYVELNALIIAKHLKEPLKGIRLHSLSVPRMERIILDLSAKGVGPRSINTVLQALRVPISDYARKHRVPDPLQYLGKVAEVPKERGTLSIDEISRIVKLRDESPRLRCAVLLGALCGLRLGEACGLQWEDIDESAGIIHVIHNWQAGEGVKAPKCGSKRDVPLPAAVLEIVNLCKATAPEGSRFVLWNAKDKMRPADKNAIERGFRRILGAIGIDEKARTARNLCIHGLRHSYVSITRATGLPDWVTMRLAGHKTMKMTDRYSHSENIIDFPETKRIIDSALSQ